MRILSYLQTLLKHIYGLDVEEDVQNFVFTDEKILAALSDGRHWTSKRENLLIATSEDELGLSLFLEDDLLSRLKQMDPTNNLHEGNMNDFWAVLEGVSHFLYVVQRASGKRTFSLLELELQAEVDKYIGSVYLARQQENRILGRNLHRLLFDATDFENELNESTRKRYQDANYYASRYCWQLQQSYFNGAGAKVVQELRHFYRLPHQAKKTPIDGGFYGGPGSI